MDITQLLFSQVSTATTTVDIGIGVIAFRDTFTAFGMGVLEGLASLFATLFILSRVGPLNTWLADTRADWVIPAMRALAILGGGLVAGLLSPGGLMAGLGGLLGAAPVAWTFIETAVKEAKD